MTIFTTKFWADAGERALKTIAQSLLSLLVVGDQVFSILNVNFAQAGGVALSAGVISILMSIVTASVTSTDSASLAVNTIEKK